MKHPLLSYSYSNDELMQMFLQEVVRVNPNIKIGVRLSGPCARVWDGKIFEEEQALADPEIGTVKLDIHVPHVPRPSELVSVKSVKVHMTDDFSQWRDYQYKFLYPYEITIPHLKWLAVKQPGDVIDVIDEEWQVTQVKVTQELIDLHSYAIFRYAPGD